MTIERSKLWKIKSPEENVTITYRPITEVALDKILPSMLRVKAVNAIGTSGDINGFKILQDCIREDDPAVSSWAHYWISNPITLEQSDDISKIEIPVPNKEGIHLIREYEILAARLRQVRGIINDIGKKGITYDEPFLLDHFQYKLVTQQEILDIESDLAGHKIFTLGIREDIASFLTRSDLEILEQAGLKVRPLLEIEKKQEEDTPIAFKHLKSLVQQYQLSLGISNNNIFRKVAELGFKNFKDTVLTAASQQEREDFIRSYWLLSAKERAVLRELGINLEDEVSVK